MIYQWYPIDQITPPFSSGIPPLDFPGVRVSELQGMGCRGSRPTWSWRLGRRDMTYFCVAADVSQRMSTVKEKVMNVYDS